MPNCYCGLPTPYLACCGRYVDHHAPAPTPEALMRSRYSAYVQAKTDYIAQTMRGKAAQGYDIEQSRVWAARVEWLGLNVLSAKEEGLAGEVVFYAKLSEAGKKSAIHERSMFEKEGEQWFYVDGQLQKPVRNEPCPCGSGKKYKKCCI